MLCMQPDKQAGRHAERTAASLLVTSCAVCFPPVAFACACTGLPCILVTWCVWRWMCHYPHIILFLPPTVGAPLWAMLAARMRPACYIQTAATALFASYLMVFCGMLYNSTLPVIITLVGLGQMVGSPLMSLGFLGEEDVEVSEVSVPVCVCVCVCECRRVCLRARCPYLLP